METGDGLSDLWAGVVESLAASNDVSPADLAFARLSKPLGIIDGTLLLAVPSTMVKDRLEIRLRSALLETLARWPDDGVQRFAVTVDTGLGDSDEEPPLPAAAGPGATPALVAVPSPSPVPVHEPTSRLARPTPRDADPSRLNPKYTFETFVIGPSNRFASAAARAVAEAPARAYNPLFIYGGSGLGKTHLLHAIGHYARNLMPELRVRYVNSEEFTNDFINSIRDDKAQSFQRRYRNVDVLLIDDIQFLGGKEQTVEEFFHTFNSLHNDQKQVVITSDTPPKKLRGFEDRLISRFEWGLLTDVQPPDLETRIAILQKKSQAEGLKAEDEVLSFIATRITTNIRELEGALLRVTAFANLNQQPVELPLAELVLRDLVSDDDLQEITPALIIKETSEYFSISVETLRSPDRSRPIATARQIAMYLCRELTDLSLPKIGQMFGGRDHTTVIYANRKIAEGMREKRVIYNQVTELTSRIKQHARSHGG
ncbi:MAG TPA: chromosomal replication initiator protein DnaA [Actinomycetaceae bacterium]|nr:chromosomal replication initiator protein DnaA [Actinomycetaceae bacterium]